MLGMFATIVIQREYKTEQIRSFDLGGFISVTVFLTFLLLALTSGNSAWNTGGWTSPFVVTCSILATLGAIAFFVVETTVAHPLIDLSLMKNFNFALTNVVLFIFGMGMFGSIFLLPLYLQNSMGYTAYQTGLMFLPAGILQGAIAPLSGYLSDKKNPQLPALVGIILLAVSLYMNSFLSVFSERDQIMVSLYLRGIGMGLLFTPLSTLALSEVPRRKMAQASGLFNVIRQVGGSFGVAIFGAMLTRRMIHHSAMYGEALDQSSPPFHAAVAKLQFFAQHTVGGTSAESLARAKALLMGHMSNQAFVTAISDDFFIAAAITIVCIIPILFLRVHKRKAGTQEMK
jgi:DHA2 family multidrug resistance protein